MFTIQQSASGVTEVKGSKFITVLTPYNQFAQSMAEMRSTHSKAGHFVYASRFFNEHDQIVENQSDDGEPKGSSGKPTLGVLAGKQLVNTAAITARYFGGTKLGVGGLVRAYSEAANLAIENAELVPFVFTTQITAHVDYAFFDKFQHMIAGYDIVSMEKRFGASTVICEIVLSRDLLSTIQDLFKENLAVKIELTRCD